MRTTRRDYASGTTGKEQNCMAKVKKKKRKKRNYKPLNVINLPVCRETVLSMA